MPVLNRSLMLVISALLVMVGRGGYVDDNALYGTKNDYHRQEPYMDYNALYEKEDDYHKRTHNVDRNIHAKGNNEKREYDDLDKYEYTKGDEYRKDDKYTKKDVYYKQKEYLINDIVDKMQNIFNQVKDYNLKYIPNNRLQKKLPTEKSNKYARESDSYNQNEYDDAVYSQSKKFTVEKPKKDYADGDDYYQDRDVDIQKSSLKVNMDDVMEDFVDKMQIILWNMKDYKLNYLPYNKLQEKLSMEREVKSHGNKGAVDNDYSKDMGVGEKKPRVPMFSDISCHDYNNPCQYKELCVEVDGSIGCACPPDMINDLENPRYCVKADLCSIGFPVDSADATRQPVCPTNSRCVYYNEYPMCRCEAGTSPVYDTNVSLDHNEIIFPFQFLDVKCVKGCAVKGSTKYLSDKLRRHLNELFDAIQSNYSMKCEYHD